MCEDQLTTMNVHGNLKSSCCSCAQKYIRMLVTIVEDRNKAIFVTWNGVGEYGEGLVCVFMSARSARKQSVMKKIRLLTCRLYDIACFVQLVYNRACGVKLGSDGAGLTSSSD